jgi:uncharacterized membrane protein YhiD involved in acid resistance
VLAGIGMACGFGLYVHAAITTAIAVVVLMVLGLIAARLFGQPVEFRPDERSRD